ncbi:hypothetical protein [Actinomycetospora sp. NBRC 106378]|uniref:hypothetical protein n=1 Tax=Actinomycetospora sp. NBRC 106378 TaxID=3032208 RepID=UPI0024A23402|nr:hypothetical protein [Actinomycetospora sp. NBRC 106378]GLZ53108.1 hypothetical protein Acsp07_27250 [Actinomycetospora sp. NBRC 106378]
MLPDGYGDFFLATATVAGALIGLLFVAISVHPEGASRSARSTTRLRAIAALSAFLDTLVLSLLALRPRPQLGDVAVTLGALGLVAMATLLILLASDRPTPVGPRIRGVVLVVGQAVLYVLQVTDGVALSARPDDAAAVDGLSVVVIVLFVLGIGRAWEFAGADNPGLLGTAVATATGRGVRSSAEDDRSEATPHRP